MTAPFGSGYERIVFERDDCVLIATLSRPETLNSVDARMHHELIRFLSEVDRDPGSLAVIVTGAGRAFCSGGDVNGMSSPAGTPLEAAPDAVHSPGWHLVQAMLALEKPIVAMVNGAAVGLGATLALMCDHALMADEAKMGDRHVQVGLVAGDGFGPMAAMLAGVNKAKELVMLGTLVSGAEAARIGLVARSMPLERLREETLAVAHELARQPPFALRASKLALNRLAAQTLDGVLEASLAWEHLSMARDDHHEATRAWLESRK
jgi:enoyl-CoA hydratase